MSKTKQEGALYKEEDLNDMDHLDVVKLANAHFGLGLTVKMDKSQVIDQFLKAQGKYQGNSQIRLLKDGEEVEVPKGYLKIRVQPGKHNPNNRPVFIAHNFKAASVPVNRDVIIPAYYESCLRDAIQREYFFDKEAQTLVAQDVQAYPYSVLERG